MLSDNEQRELRNALGTFATGVTVVTASDEDGRPFGMTANSFASLSLDPPLVLWNIGHDSWCYKAFLDTRYFAVHVLTENQALVSDHFARKSADKFEAIAWQPGPHGVPVFDEFMSCFICHQQNVFNGGDHDIIVGRIESHEVRDEFRPLIFYRGRYDTLNEI